MAILGLYYSPRVVTTKRFSGTFELSKRFSGTFELSPRGYYPETICPRTILELYSLKVREHVVWVGTDTRAEPCIRGPWKSVAWMLCQLRVPEP